MISQRLASKINGYQSMWGGEFERLAKEALAELGETYTHGFAHPIFGRFGHTT
jgi:hypothetical protein